MFTCFDKLKTTWYAVKKLSPKQQPRFAHNNNCKYRKVFDSFNNWIILHIVTTSENDNYDLNDVNIDVLDSILF